MSMIKIHCRIRPLGANAAMQATGEVPCYKVDYNENLLEIDVPSESQAQGRKPEYVFKFSRIYDDKATQEEVFEPLIRPLLSSFLEGVNCTVFCYGETGSGKTYTMTGGAGAYKQRGMMPRAIEEIFRAIKADETREYQLFASYLQILNEGGFDLLSAGAAAYAAGNAQSRALEDLERVKLQEDGSGEMHVENLSAHACRDVEAALNVLWNGDLNRIVTATSQNQASSRSHCIFTLHLRSRAAGSDVVRQSKFHFVDLAGSERVGKTGADGIVLEQAKYINGSLFFLEMVIHALARHDDHIPYRNSMMTFFLRDSLGGNCKTIMLATLGFEKQNLAECISTCLFAENVALIKNQAVVNESVDLQTLVKRLKEENLRLKEEIKLLKEGESASADKVISAADDERIRAILSEFLQNRGVDDALSVGNYWKLQHAIRIMREMLTEPREASSQQAPSAIQAAPSVPENDSEIQRLRRLLQQRDAEIEVLTQMVGGTPSEPKRTEGPMFDYETVENDLTERNASRHDDIRFVENASVSSSKSESDLLENEAIDKQVIDDTQEVPSRPPRVPTGVVAQEKRAAALSGPQHLCGLKAKDLTLTRLREENELFQDFIQQYYKEAEMSQNRADLKELYGQAKQLAAVIQKQRAAAEDLKREILQVVQAAGQETEESDLLKAQLEKLSEEYKQGVAALRETKCQIEALEAEMNHCKTEIKQDFVKWYKYAVGVVTERMKGDGQLQQQAQETVERDIQAFYDLKSQLGV